jgi:GT2 family glycosyltransferase
MADPNRGDGGDADRTQRLLTAACDSIRGFETELNRSRGETRRLREALAAIHSSRGWAFLQRYYRLRNKLLPPGGRAHSFMRWATRRSKRRGAVPTAEPGVYPRWIEQLEPNAFAEWPAAPPDSGAAPRIHILLTGESPALQASIQLIHAQTDPNWSLLTAPAPDAWNKALESIADGFVVVLHAGDLLAPAAVAVLRHALSADPKPGMIYSDEDALDDQGRRCDPHFKRDWAPETFRAMNYVGDLAAFDVRLVREVGGFRPAFGAAAPYDLALRIAEKTDRIRHVPLVLYHRRAPRTNDEAANIRAVQEHLDRTGVHAEVRAGLAPGTQQIRYAVGSPLVSTIIPSKDQPRLLSRCVETLLAADYPNQEILIVDTGSVTPEALAVNARLEQRPGVRLLHWDRKPFNYAAVNNFAARQARGEVLAFINDDTEVITPDWLERMLEHALRPEVGAVGAKLLYPNGAVQHAGIVLGITEHHCGHYLNGALGDAPGYANRLAAVQNLSAVTGACLVMRRAVFEDVGGFDEQFAGDYNDVDLCLRLRRRGLQVIWTPHARLVHHQCQTRGHIINPARHAQLVLERLLFLERWGEEIARGDPYYSPHLTRDAEDCSVRQC